MNSVLIMAGGKGTRFWPLSTESEPKQFLNLSSERSMIRESFERLLPIIAKEQIFVSTGAQYVQQVVKHLPELPFENIIVEPASRNTAPSIALAALLIKHRHPEIDAIAVLPSDHLIGNPEEFRTVLSTGFDFLKYKPTSIVTIGITPDRPEIGYGYIKISGDHELFENREIDSVDCFVEKPNLIKAQEYLENPNFLWNSGMFLWTVDGILDLVATHLPKTYHALSGLLSCPEEQIDSYIQAHYEETDLISIDYGILEKSKALYVIPSEFGWSDLGNWCSYGQFHAKDEAGNVFNAEGKLYNSHGNVVIANKTIVLNNVDDLIIVETNDYILISSKEHEQEIKLAKGELK